MSLQTKKQETLLIIHAVDAMIYSCANSYINTYTEHWLRLAREVGGYKGSVTGNCAEVQTEWRLYLEECFGTDGLPELPTPARFRGCKRRAYRL